MGADATAIAWRRGHVITKIEKRRGIDTMQTTGWIAKIIREDKPAKINVVVVVPRNGHLRPTDRAGA